MIIKKLILHNFGVYAGTNEFLFEKDKPVVLIGGMNGRGKTTFLEAVLLSLYGQNSFDYKESKYTSYGTYLRAHVNETDGSFKSYVDMEFIIEGADNESYYIHREWSGRNHRTLERIKVLKNGEENEFLSKNWSMYVENILPSALAKFFFFDGEKIAVLATEDTSEELKNSIKALLGLTVLDILGNDIQKIIKKISKADTSEQDVYQIQTLTKKRDDAYDVLAQINEECANLELAIQDETKKLEECNNRYMDGGGFAYTMQPDLIEEKRNKGIELEGKKEILRGYAASELPLFLISNLLEKVHYSVEEEQESNKAKEAMKIIKGLQAAYNVEKDVVSTDINDFVDFAERQASALAVKNIYNLSDHAYMQFRKLTLSYFNHLKENVQQEIYVARKLQDRIDEIDNDLAIDIDETQLNKLWVQIKEHEHNIAAIEIEIAAKNKERSKANGEAIRANAEFTRGVEEMLKNMESMDDNQRINKYAHLVIKILDEYKLRLQRSKTGMLAGTMFTCYKQLASKRSLIGSIAIDPVSLDILYYDNEGRNIPKASLSAGESQLMVISLLWALGICSKKKLPVIIDTPLARLDSSHRETLLTTYFPKASKQTIILSTDSEVNTEAYSMLAEYVGDKFTLIYDDDTKSTTVHKGYFSEE